MVSCNKPCLASELTIHINIKYHIELYIFVTWINLTTHHLFQKNTLQFLKDFPSILNLFPYSIPPVRFICLVTNAIFLLYTLGGFYPKLMTRPQILTIYICYSLMPLHSYIINPPFEFRLLRLTVCYNMYVQFRRI